MKKAMNSLKFLAAGLFAVAMMGCSTTNHLSVEPWQGQIWRGVVVANLVDTTDFRPTDKAWITAVHYDDQRDFGMRMARVHISSGWNSVMANAGVPDSIEFAQIPKGTLVDMVTETGPDMNYAQQRFTRIIRVICAKGDDKCFDVENKANRVRAVIDAHPGDVNKEYGLTFNRRTTKEDVSKYN
ncbi:hypothetical protein [Janthinobacterium sp. PSPC2-1]|uniref:hypothetical protein n=1 Tax=unclassified Janthinobacterium TaxID=2610881 RepID=UPI003CE8A49F